MISKSRQKKIARQIAALEQIREMNIGKNPELVEKAENELITIPEKYNLGLSDLLVIDDMVQDILKNRLT